MEQNVFMVHGNAIIGQIVLMVLMKLIVLLLHVLIKDYGIVVMDSVLIRVMYVMDQVNFVMQVGDQIVLMVQMKV